MATIPKPLGACDGGHGDGVKATLPEEPPTGDEPESKNDDEAASFGTLTAGGATTKAVEIAGSTRLVPKRVRQPSDNDGQDSGAVPPDEPPPKTTLSRRGGVRPKPNIPPDRRSPATPSSQ
ncbi:hypothetical protein IscW_ISCW003991 [Ixodes scapularis]|uniref:Uncharacterized protein n=1 Tax=Ixodes scapularis TaxID=6945 RepID=B7PHE4_IXOSC|nr:hypothetical protein IscW_ISCW003991 [Ixodes scapularis]|eukprot:XP_002402697.1 hypothetical protein IscW_ISCW003991 [Ixodes scapularis]